MQQEIPPNLTLYFEDPRLQMTITGRFFVRVAMYIGYLVSIAAMGTLVISDIGWLRSLGVFFALFLADRVLHRGEADSSLSEVPEVGRLNLASYLRPKCFSVIEKAHDRSLITKKNFFLEAIGRLLEFDEVKDGILRLDVKIEELRQKAEEFLKESEKADAPASVQNGGAESTKISKSLKEINLANVEKLVGRAMVQAMEAKHEFIELSDLFSAMPLVDDKEASRLFKIFEIDPGDLSRALIFSSVGRGRFLRRIPSVLSGFIFGSQKRIRHRIMNRAWTSRPTPVLDAYSSDLTDLARQEQIGFLIGHETEFERLIDTLARPINPNALLVGEIGIGKETLVAHLASRLIKDEVPSPLFDKRLVSLELSNLVAGAKPEELNQRLAKIVEEIIIAGNIILYIPDIHNLVKTSGTAYISAADALMPIVMNNSFPIVGSTYPREFKQLIEPRSDFSGIFETIRVQEIAPAEAEKILTYESLILEQEYKIKISFGAIKKSVLLGKKYFTNKFLPSSAEEVLKSALVEAKRLGEKLLGPERVMIAVERKTKVPIREAGEAEARKLLNMEDTIHRRLIDQEEAVKVVADALREYRSGLSRPGGPIASFLFVGPTGVGKTELAKILAGIQFGSKESMVRFDMTEYQDKQSFYRFIGSPDGSVNGTLTDAILQKPYSLILLDEFEKAFPDILNLFLQVLDDGRLTDNLGRVVNFENTIIIATSNAHSDIINEALSKGESMADIAEYLKRRLVDVFKPELMNRFSKIVIFKNLLPADLEKIVVLNLQDLTELVAEQGMVLDYDLSAIKLIAKLGFDPSFGARPLRRVIEERVRAPLASKILEKKAERGSRIKLVANGENFEFVLEDKSQDV